jgi:ankyrin repeat protein
MKRRVREIYPSTARPEGKRASHFFAPATQGIYDKLKDLIENGSATELFQHLNYMSQKGYSIDKQCYPEQQTALHLAVLTDKPPIVNAMLRAGASQSVADENDALPIFVAVKNQRLNSLQCLIGALGPNGYKITSVKKRTLLHMAVFWGASKILDDMLYAYRGDEDFVNAKDDNGNTPLHYIHATDDEKIVQALLNAGADPLEPNDLGIRPHFQAAINDACGSLAYLLTHAKGINYAEPGIKQRNLLHVATYFGSAKVLKFLLNRYGHDKNFLNAQNDIGETPLHIAARSGNRDLYGLILRAGADTTIVDKHGLTPVVVAQGRGSYTDYDSTPELMSSENQQRLAGLDDWLRSLREESSDSSSTSMVSALTV